MQEDFFNLEDINNINNNDTLASNNVSSFDGPINTPLENLMQWEARRCFVYNILNNMKDDRLLEQYYFEESKKILNRKR